jgi:hypothetical protein
MKNHNCLLFAAIITIIFAAQLRSQGLYFGIGGGYGFAAGKQTMNADQKTEFTANKTTYEYTSRPISFGKGICAGIYGGYMFTENLGAELGLAYLIGGKNVYTYEVNNTPGNFKAKEVATYRSQMIRIVPALRMTVGDDALKPYMKCGMIIGVGGKVTEETIYEASGASNARSERLWEYSGGLSLGFHGALGVTYMISDKMGIFAETAANLQSWAMKKGQMTKYDLDGKDQLPQIDGSEKEIEFVDSYTIDSSALPDVNSPSKELRQYLPFSSIGINIGIHFTLGGGDNANK